MDASILSLECFNGSFASIICLVCEDHHTRVVVRNMLSSTRGSQILHSMAIHYQSGGYVSLSEVGLV